MSDVFKDFIKAQKEFGKAAKDATNPHFKSKYADLASCVDAVLSALNNNNFALMQTTAECETGVKVSTLFIHESGDQISGGSLYIPAGVKKDAHAFGSALTYARRYSLLAAAGIAPEDDDGNAAVAQQSQQRQPAVDTNALANGIKAAMTLDELKKAWCNVPKAYQPKLEALKDTRKAELPA